MTGKPEEDRLSKVEAREEDWQRWGTYLPERQWGTVREDYSADGNAWSFTHDMARYRAYRWGEDGILGWTDRQCRLCFSTSLWNGNDPILKERLFGLVNLEGNHGEDVKEQFYYLDGTPTHSYAKGLYKYPQRPFPYEDLVVTNRERTLADREYELMDTGIFDQERYFDVGIEYAKASPEDTLIRLTISNRGPDDAPLIVAPTLTLRNDWSWRKMESSESRPWMRLATEVDGAIDANHSTLGAYRFSAIEGTDLLRTETLFTENDTNVVRLDPSFKGSQGFSKDAFDRYLVQGDQDAVNRDNSGTKVAFVFRLELKAGETTTLRLRLAPNGDSESGPMGLAAFDNIFSQRKAEADQFYNDRTPASFTEDERHISRQAYAGLLWSKQFYHYVTRSWLEGDSAQPAPPPERLHSANAQWRHLFCRDIISVPDKWEYPWFAAWDTAFHMIPMAEIDPAFAKNQLLLLLRAWYMHPNGQIPAYEFDFGDVNPPVHAWSVMHLYYLEGYRKDGHKDVDFLERAFQKLLLNFTWWVNRHDADGKNLFGGGFLGLDNIGVFDRNVTLPDGITLNQADGTAWMGLYCSAMLTMAIELAQTRPAYEDIASKFFEHYIAIIDAINDEGTEGLWDDELGFYFDRLQRAGGDPISLKLRSIVGVVPLYAVCILRRDQVARLPGFQKRLHWFLANRPGLAGHVSDSESDDPAHADSQFIALVPKDRLIRILQYVLDESEFLSPYGIRALSKYHQDHPYEIELGGQKLVVKYLPAEGDGRMFGGNSNWRGPVWFPLNALLLHALERYYAIYGNGLKVEFPTGSGTFLNLLQVRDELLQRLVSLFTRDKSGVRPVHGGEGRYAQDPHWRELIQFNEYFCGDTGRGVGASHQTGWTALVATCLMRNKGEDRFI